VRLALRSDALRASAWRGRWRARRSADSRFALDAKARSSEADAQALRSLLDQLAAQAPIAGSTLHVELSDELLHFDVAEGEFAGLGTRTLGTFAEACMAELLGEQAGACTLRWQLQRDERHLLVCALPRHWLDAIDAAARAHKLQVAGIRPRFERQWNRHLGALRSPVSVFAVAEGAHALIACVRDGVITALSSGPWCADVGQFSDSVVDRLMAGMGLVGKESVTLLDLQVDRLLAGLGIDLAAPADFVLVCAGEPHVYLSQRWVVRPARGTRP
jgi:hypothetical protein